MCCRENSASTTALPPLRAAFADEMYFYIANGGCDGLELLYFELGCRDADSVWTRARVDQSIEDLVNAGRAEVSGKRGYVVVDVIFDDAMAEYLGSNEAPLAEAAA